MSWKVHPRLRKEKATWFCDPKNNELVCSQCIPTLDGYALHGYHQEMTGHNANMKPTQASPAGRVARFDFPDRSAA
jgi:hypothetical protein